MTITLTLTSNEQDIAIIGTRMAIDARREFLDTRRYEDSFMSNVVAYNLRVAEHIYYKLGGGDHNYWPAVYRPAIV